MPILKGYGDTLAAARTASGADSTKALHVLRAVPTLVPLLGSRLPQFLPLLMVLLQSGLRHGPPLPVGPSQTHETGWLPVS